MPRGPVNRIERKVAPCCRCGEPMLLRRRKSDGRWSNTTTCKTCVSHIRREVLAYRKKGRVGDGPPPVVPDLTLVGDDPLCRGPIAWTQVIDYWRRFA
jgi:hypothetical protein